MHIFEDLLVALDLRPNTPYKEKWKIRHSITSTRGTVSYIISQKSSFLVTNRQNLEDSYKCRQAEKLGIPIVSTEFLYKSIEQNKLEDVEEYLIVDKAKNDKFDLGKIAAPEEITEKAPLAFNLANVKSWNFKDTKQPHFDEENYEVAKYCILKSGTTAHHNSHCILEIHVVPSDAQTNTNRSSHRMRIYSHVLTSGSHGDDKEVVRYLNTSQEALAVYNALYNYFTEKPHNFERCSSTPPRKLGSAKFQVLFDEFESGESELPPEMKRLVELIWQEALGEIDSIISVPVASIKLDQLDKAESVLLEMRRILSSEPSLLPTLSGEFYSHLPHNSQYAGDITTVSHIARMQDMCQLVRDIVTVSEATNWNARCSSKAKYAALRCRIGHLKNESDEFKTMSQYILDSTNGHSGIHIRNLYSIRRQIENINFRKNLDNKKLLFHSSASRSYVGILSRGLLLPRMVVEDYGGVKTDAGMLGPGIYFADSATTSVKYSQPCNKSGTRLMLVNEVALGKCTDFNTYQTDLERPPQGYQSCHGVKNSNENKSDFTDDEYCVYDVTQQRLQYLVEFTIPGDKPVDQIGISGMMTNTVKQDEETGEDIFDLDISDVLDIKDPLQSVQPGLVSQNNINVPLKSVHVRAKLLDLAASAVVLQEYRNDSNEAIEAKYVFPLDEMAVVCGFEAFINGKHIIGEVKEKEKAHREYKKAISEGHGAYLMDQSEETPDVFTVSVGNLPAHCTVLIKITYVAELQTDGERICYRVPGSVAPWTKDAGLSDVTQTDLDTVKIEREHNDVSIHVAIEMPFDIRAIECPSHDIHAKKTATKAVVEMMRNQPIRDGFVLYVTLAEIHVPRMWVEQHPQLDSQACMLTFYPQFEDSITHNEVIFMLDLSNSMAGGATVTHAKKVLLLFLHHLPEACLFNVLVFGSTFEELFVSSVAKNDVTVQKVWQFIQNKTANLGNTHVHRALHSYQLLGDKNSVRNVLLISDGHVTQCDDTLRAITRHQRHIRVFTCAVSATANKHTLRSMARLGGGAFEYFDSQTKSK